jgi:uncharacterized protein (TIGR02996 family)
VSDEAAFMRAIQDQPDDSLVRLVYADWLEERGDDRHRLIRVEEAMRPHKIWSDEFQRLKPERNHLRKQFAGDWLNTMGYAPIHRPMFGEMPPTAEGRWRLAEEFIDIWHGGLRPGDGYTDEELDATEQRLGVSLPKALSDWYRFGGKRGDIWSNQDNLVLPTIPDGQSLLFRYEYQNETRWYIRRDDLELPDPPVYGGDPVRMVSNAVSAFAQFVLVYESQFRNILCNVYHSVTQDRSITLPSRFRLAAIHGWYWFDWEVQFWEATDTIIMCNFDDWWYANCRNEAAYEQLVADFGDRVERHN